MSKPVRTWAEFRAAVWWRIRWTFRCCKSSGFVHTCSIGGNVPQHFDGRVFFHSRTYRDTTDGKLWTEFW